MAGKEVREDNMDNKEKVASEEAADVKDRYLLAEPSLLLQLGSALLPSNYMNLSPRWQGWFVRGQSGILLMSCFYTLVSLGPPGLFFLTCIVQLASFYEVMQLGHSVTKVEGLKTWSWLLFCVANLHYLDPSVSSLLPISPPQKTALCYILYTSLMVWFVLSIRKTSQCLTRYCLLAWAHMAILFLTVQAYLMNLTLQHGMVWYIFSMSIITINDIAAYMFGFFFGSTPLIVLSPKKTVEGFLGGGLVTILLGPAYGYFLQQFPYLTCPTENLSITNCDPEDSATFSGDIPAFVMHCFIISLFASTIGPVAGFFCSGFKRACNKKNFGSLIPGHGGVLDRCDCMFLMASFTYMYLENIVF
eukprot:GFUD01002369.1.p1 GENE.GFUD01002369.1~~GFUD01002369.1.p1  ORF type:complete len:360 (+),score=86.17 GFUD01002369.1:114-1193(+)